MENESLNKKNALDESIPDRDFDFELPLNKELYDKYVNGEKEKDGVEGIATKIKRLGNDKAFVSDNSFNGVKANHHIMYKCKLNDNDDDNGNTLLLSSDGHIGHKGYRKNYELIVGYVEEDESVKSEVNGKAVKTVILIALLCVVLYYVVKFSMSIWHWLVGLF